MCRSHTVLLYTSPEHIVIRFKMIKWLKTRVKKRNAFKAYRGKLRKLLLHKYGKSRILKHHQVEQALTELNLSGEFDYYAYAMALSESQFKHYQKIKGVTYSQDALQIELGVNHELLKTQHFSAGGYGP
ncbi:MAG: hypothetical protein PVI97_13920 [Candidatus Thiodiazotropha sp.]